MKVYVSELPKYCADNCPCFEYNEYWDKCYCSGRCEIEDKYKKPQDCPLQSLSDHTKQVRKEVVQEIRGNSSLEFYEEFDGFSYHSGTKYIIKDSDLEKIQNSD